MRVKFICAIFFYCLLSVCSEVCSQWLQQLSSTNAELLDVFFVNENTGFVTGRDGKILKTTNGGSNWTQSTVNPYFKISQVYFVNEQTGYFACEYDYDPLFLYYIYKTTNAGLSWTEDYYTDSSRTAAITFINANTGYFASTKCDSVKGTKIYRKTSSSSPWQLISSLDSCGLIAMKFLDNTGYWIGSTGGLIFKSTNSGSNWIQFNTGLIESLNDLHMFNKDTVIAAGESGKIMRTINGGQNWDPVNSGTSHYLLKISFSNSTTGYITTSGNIFLKTTNAGQSWGSFSTGFLFSSRSVYFINSLTGYLVGTNGSILKTTNGGEPIGITIISNEIPQRFELLQNYPNPFNPTTNIEFRIAEDGFVRLTIYDVLGNELKSIVNDELPPGTYKVEWDADNISSGVYFYELSVVKTNSRVFRETKKLIITK